jgi:hypothetical protein
MPENSLKTVESQVDFASKSLSLAFKFGVLIGGACLVFYCYRLHYFPVGLTVADGVLLIIVATSFGIVYGLFVICMTALGLWFTPLLRPLQSLIHRLRQKRSKRVRGEPIELATPDLCAFVFGLLGILFIYFMGKSEPSAILTLLATSLLLGLIYAIHREASANIDKIRKSERASIIPGENEPKLLDSDTSKNRYAKALSTLAMFVIPLVVSGVSGVLLDGGMRFANIRKTESFVLLRAPYSNLIPPSFLTNAKDFPSFPDYKTFERVEVVFSGLGQKTVLEFQGEKKRHRLEIPNEYIYVLSH